MQSSQTRLTSNEIEAANRAEATALLIRSGYRVYRPEADCYGEDLVLRLHRVLNLGASCFGSAAVAGKAIWGNLEAVMDRDVVYGLS